MTEKELYQLKYPIGEFKTPKNITKAHLHDWIYSIESLPQRIQEISKNLSENQLNYKYRPNGWTIKQVIHHCADSHMNSIIRFKLALTEESPTIRPYFEDRFAKLSDYNEPIFDAISILNGVHSKLSILLKNLNDDQLKLEFIHPEYNLRFSIAETIGVYAWHSDHHYAHIKQALKSEGQFN